MAEDFRDYPIKNEADRKHKELRKVEEENEQNEKMTRKMIHPYVKCANLAFNTYTLALQQQDPTLQITSLSTFVGCFQDADPKNLSQIFANLRKKNPEKKKTLEEVLRRVESFFGISLQNTGTL